MAEPRFQSLTKAAIKSLSNVSRSFKIVDSIDETGMGKTNSAAEEPFKHLKELVISVDPRVYNDYDDKTVYVVSFYSYREYREPQNINILF